MNVNRPCGASVGCSVASHLQGCGFDCCLVFVLVEFAGSCCLTLRALTLTDMVCHVDMTRSGVSSLPGCIRTFPGQALD